MTDQTVGQENVLKFRALMDSDRALQSAVNQHVGNGNWDAAAIVEIGRARGLAFSADDIRTVMEEDDELSDFELELVAAAAGVSCGGNDL